MLSTGVFAPRGNVKAAVLTKIILEATIPCEQARLHVDYICCDGAAWNRAMWHNMGIHGSCKGVWCKGVHPRDKDRFLHFVGFPAPRQMCVERHDETRLQPTYRPGMNENNFFSWTLVVSSSPKKYASCCRSIGIMLQPPGRLTTAWRTATRTLTAPPTTAPPRGTHASGGQLFLAGHHTLTVWTP